MMFNTKLLFVSLLLSFFSLIVGDNTDLTQYTPDKTDWTTFQTKTLGSNLDHSPDGVSWISREEWIPWDGTVYNPTEYSRNEFAELICPGNTVRGMRELFYETEPLPFQNVKNPTKAEVDNWHMLVLNHIRNMVGYSEPEYHIEPNTCLHVRALFSQERHRTNIWDTKYPDDTCVGSTNSHCGATFVPEKNDQVEYLPPGTEFCNFEVGGSEGLSSGGKAHFPWSIKWIRPFCGYLSKEGFWGGHVGPFFSRKYFGWSWRDIDPNNPNSNTQTRLKWGGPQGSPKYENPNKEKFLIYIEEPFGVDPNATYADYACIIPEGLSFDDDEKYFKTAQDATDCYRQVMADDKCGKQFLTFNTYDVGTGIFGCACYPPEMESCEPIKTPFQQTWDFRPISYTFDGLSIDIKKPYRYPALPWENAECPNIAFVTKAASLSQCLEKLVEADFKFCVNGFQFDCEQNLMTWNKDGGSCGCYPLNSQICDRENEALGRRGRLTHEIKIDPSYIPALTTGPPKVLACGTRSPTVSSMPSASPSQAPSDSIQYVRGYFINTQENLNRGRYEPLPWKDRVCPNVGGGDFYITADSPTDCLMRIIDSGFKIVKNGKEFECADNLLTWITKLTNNCACYPKDQAICDGAESTKTSSRETYEIQFDPNGSNTPTTTIAPSVSLSYKPTISPSRVSTTAPSDSPSYNPTKEPPIKYFNGYYIDTTEGFNNNEGDPLPIYQRVCRGDQEYIVSTGKDDCVKQLVERNFIVQTEEEDFICSRNLMTYIRKTGKNCVCYRENTQVCGRSDSLFRSGRETYEIRFDPSVLEPTPTPTASQTISPTSEPTNSITLDPTDFPTTKPTSSPTSVPSLSPTQSPTLSPTSSPTLGPTKTPTLSPTPIPTSPPSEVPSTLPTSTPTSSPTKEPTSSPTASPTVSPTSDPTKTPTSTPTLQPTSLPTLTPTLSPITSPVSEPTSFPTQAPGLCDNNKSEIFKPSKNTYVDNQTTCKARANLKNESCNTWCSRLGTTCSNAWIPTPNGEGGEEIDCSSEGRKRSTCQCVKTASQTISPTSDPTKTPTSTPTLQPISLPTLTPTLSPITSPVSEPTSFPTQAPGLCDNSKSEIFKPSKNTYVDNQTTCKARANLKNESCNTWCSRLGATCSNAWIPTPNGEGGKEIDCSSEGRKRSTCQCVKYISQY